jgi:hypothetical protein
VGNTYNHLATTITGPQQDLNLGIETYLNGSPMNPIQLDTSQVAKDTIDYVATDQSGLTVHHHQNRHHRSTLNHPRPPRHATQALAPLNCPQK